MAGHSTTPVICSRRCDRTAYRSAPPSVAPRPAPSPAPFPPPHSVQAQLLPPVYRSSPLLLLIMSQGSRRGDEAPPPPGYSAFFTAAATTSGYPRNQSVSLTNLPSWTWKICTHPPPSWSVGVILSGGTRPPKVNSWICSKPFFTSAPVGCLPPVAFSALRIASTWSAALRIPRL